MKKSKKVVLAVVLLIFVAASVCIAVIYRNYNVVRVYDNEHRLEYDGKTYYYLNESKYYEFITDEIICEKKEPLFPVTYYTLQNDANHDFIYSSRFRDHRLYTSLPISGYEDVIKGEPTSVILYKSGYKSETSFVSDNMLAVEEAVNLKSLEDAFENNERTYYDNYGYTYQNDNQFYIDDYSLETYGKQEHDGWYYIHVFYDNLPIASNITGITIVDHFGEYMLLCSTTDYTYSGVVIENGAITDLIESIK